MEIPHSADAIELFNPRFRRILRVTEQALLLSLATARETTSHAGDKGSNVEGDVREVLRQYLPATFSVGNGKVYDAYDDESKQAEVIITNPDHPIRYPDDKAGAYVIDGVSAVGEVKSVLTTGELADCIEKALPSSVCGKRRAEATLSQTVTDSPVAGRAASRL